MSGSSLNLTCVAVGSPMPHIKWQKGSQDVSPELTPPIGKNVLQLHNIQESANFTCVAGSKLGVIEAKTVVKVQGESGALTPQWYPPSRFSMNPVPWVVARKIAFCAGKTINWISRQNELCSAS